MDKVYILLVESCGFNGKSELDGRYVGGVYEDIETAKSCMHNIFDEIKNNSTDFVGNYKDEGDSISWLTFTNENDVSPNCLWELNIEIHNIIKKGN